VTPIARQRDRATRELKYVIEGATLIGESAQVAAKIGASGRLFIITVYVVRTLVPQLREQRGSLEVRNAQLRQRQGSARRRGHSRVVLPVVWRVLLHRADHA
jgi:hypothetical protein